MGRLVVFPDGAPVSPHRAGRGDLLRSSSRQPSFTFSYGDLASMLTLADPDCRLTDRQRSKSQLSLNESTYLILCHHCNHDSLLIQIYCVRCTIYIAITEPERADIHILFIPYSARGHTIPLVDAALLFARRGGVRCTVVTTPGNSACVHDALLRAKDFEGLPVDLELVPFPAAEVGLPEGTDCTDNLPTGLDVIFKFIKGLELLRRPIEKLVARRRPVCIVSDWLLFWAADLADSLSLPHFRFSCSSSFTNAVVDTILMASAAGGCRILDDVVQPAGLPHPLRFTREELPPSVRFPEFLDMMREAQRKSSGIMFNSFEELEPEYVAHCRELNPTGRPINVWCVGPVQLYKGLRADVDDNWGGTESWLDSKPPESVVYISFGSEGCFIPAQLREIAAALQSCGHSFIWVVRGRGGGAENMDEWLPKGFHGVVGDRGMILTGWAPQVAILNHPAVGGFMTHCGWNSTLEAVCAGLPVIAWPLHSEQFLTERQVVEVMRVGVRVLDGPGMRTVEADEKGILEGELIRNAIDRLMDARGEGTTRAMAKKYQGLARSAMERGGSSYVNLSSVIDHMNMLVKENKPL